MRPATTAVLGLVPGRLSCRLERARRSVQVKNIWAPMGDSNSSALVQIPGNDDFKYVVMPMRI